MLVPLSFTILTCSEAFLLLWQRKPFFLNRAAYILREKSLTKGKKKMSKEPKQNKKIEKVSKREARWNEMYEAVKEMMTKKHNLKKEEKTNDN